MLYACQVSKAMIGICQASTPVWYSKVGFSTEQELYYQLKENSQGLHSCMSMMQH